MDGEDSGQSVADETIPTQEALSDAVERLLIVLKASGSEAQKTGQENDTPQSPSDIAVKEAKNRQAIAEAEAATVKARRGNLADLVPDLSKANASTLTTKDEDPPVAGSILSFHAVEEAARQITTRMRVTEWGPNRAVLITNDEDLVSSTVDFQMVAIALDTAITYSELVIQEVENLPASVIQPKDADTPEHHHLETRSLAAAGLGAATLVSGAVQLGSAISSLIPQVLSFFSAKRTLRSGTAAAQDLAATAAVAGEIERVWIDRARVMHDDFRVFSNETQTFRKWTRLTECRHKLAEAKARILAGKTLIDTDLAQNKKALAGELKNLDQEKEKQKRDALETTIARLNTEVNDLTAKSLELAAGLAKVDVALDSIDSLNEGLLTVPEGARRNVLATAALREDLYDSDGTSHKITHVLLIKSQPSSWSQLLDDKPAFMDDKLAILAGASITFLLIATADQAVVNGGTVSALVQAHGKLGDGIRLTRVNTDSLSR